MILSGRWRWNALGLAALLALAPVSALGQSTDCTALRAELDAADRTGDPAKFAPLLQRQQNAIDDNRSQRDAMGCGEGLFDDADTPACQALARRASVLADGMDRLRAAASGSDPDTDARRRAMQARLDTDCAGPPVLADAPAATVPVDPDVPAAPAAPASAGPARSPVVLCVRHCDGAYYPLAVDVAPDRIGDMDRICQAQCPAAASSAYAGPDSDDISGARAADGTRYSDLATAFRFQKGVTQACACRSSNQSWAEALAGAEAMLEPHKGDVIVTPAIAASMVRPQPAPAALKPPPTGKKKAPGEPQPVAAGDPLDAARSFIQGLR